MTALYDQICNLFIRPTRQQYTDYDLGPAIISGGTRQNFSLSSSKGHALKGSFIRNKNSECDVCVLYLHSFNGSRLESLRYVGEIMEQGYHFCHFDFAGCGNSAGQYVSLGCHESRDALKVLEWVHNKQGISHFLVWGRSMGAVSAIKLYSLLTDMHSRGKMGIYKIIGLALDSAFISLKQMVVDVGRSRMNIPEFLVKALFMFVGSSIEERAKFSVSQLELHEQVEKIRCSTLLITSKDDTFVPHHHSEEIFGRMKLKEHKQIEYTTGQHYQTRSKAVIQSIFQFFKKRYKKHKEISQKLHGQKFIHSAKLIIQDTASIQRNHKSLRKYEHKKDVSQFEARPSNYGPNSLRIHIGSRQFVQFSPVKKSNQLHNMTFGSQQRIKEADNHEERPYKTEKKIQESPQIKIIISGKDVKHKNQIGNKSKPHYSGQIIDLAGKSKDLNGQSHCNVIRDKLRKKGRHQRDIAELKDFEQHCPKQQKFIPLQGPHKSDKERSKIQLGGIASPKKLTIVTQQQYIQNKSQQILHLSPLRHRSDKNQKLLQERFDRTETTRQGSDPRFEQSKSMNNLHWKTEEHQGKRSARGVTFNSTIQPLVLGERKQ